MIKLVIFDINGVLHNNKQASRNFMKEYSAFLKRHSSEEPADSDRQWKCFSSLIHRGKTTLREVRLVQLKRMGIDAKYIKEYEKIDENQMKAVKLSEPNELRALRLLKKRGCKLAALSDTLHPSYTIKKFVSAVGLGRILDGVFASSEIGHMKPHREAYETVLRYFNTMPDETIFVGHDDDEMLGARRLGIIAVSYRQSRKGDFLIRRFSELPALVDRINKSQLLGELE